MVRRALVIPQLLLVIGISLAVALGCRYFFRSDWFEVAGFVTGVVAVYLVAKEHIWNWPVGLMNVSLYAYVFFGARLYADMSLQFLFFTLGVIGWYVWLRGGTNQSQLQVSRLSGRHWGVVLASIAGGTAIYVPVITYSRGASPLWDSLLTVISIAAQVLLNLKKLENWVLWMVVDIAFIPLYLSRKLYPTAILYAIFLGLAIYGFLSWRKSLAEQANGQLIEQRNA